MGTKKFIRKNRLKTSFLIVLTAATCFLIFQSSITNPHTEEEINASQVVSSPYIPASVNFCGEEVPLRYFDVFEALERELLVNTYYHSQTALFIKKSGRYFPIIEPILRKYKVPDDFKYLAVAESGLSNASSPAGAKGYWQILEGTAKDYGLKVNDEVDERYHIEKSTEAACKFLLESYKKYEDWTLVAASYNVGRRGVDRQIDRQGEANYYDLLLNDETARYVYRILAIKLVLENPGKYGFHFSKSEIYKPVQHRVITVSESIPDFGDFARKNGTNYKLLKFLNPWLRDKQLINPQQKEYIIKIPTSRER